MGQAAHTDESNAGGMDITDQRNTFNGFMAVTVWGSALIAMCVAGLVVAFAMGAGWFAGLAVFAVLGVVCGLVLKMSAAWWATLAGSVVVLGLGGAVVAGLSGLMG